MGKILTQTRKQNIAVLDKLMYVTRPKVFTQIMSDDLVRHASADSGVSKANCKAVIEAFLTQVHELLMNGHSIQLGDIGTLRFGFRAKAVEKKDDVVLDKIIKYRKIIFTPSSEIKAELKRVKLENEFIA